LTPCGSGVLTPFNSKHNFVSNLKNRKINEFLTKENIIQQFDYLTQICERLENDELTVEGF